MFGSNPSFGLLVTGVDTAAYNFSWSPASLVDRPNGARVTITSSTYATLTVTATNKYDPSITCSASIEVNDPNWSMPVFNTSTKNTCPNTGIQIGNPNVVGYAYSWSPAEGLNSTTVSNPTATITASAVYSYEVTETATGCMTTGNVLVNVVPLVANAGNDRAVCNGGTVTLGTEPPAGSNYTYSWEPVMAAYTNGTGPTDAQPQVNFASGSQLFTVTVTDPVSGCSATSDVTLRSNVLAGEYAGAGVTVCPGEMVQLGREAEQFATYEWTLDNDAPAAGLSCTNCADPVLTASDATTTYKVKVSYPGCTLPVEDLVTVSVRTAPSFDLIDKAFCPSTPTAIGFGSAGNPAAPAGVQSYEWTPATGLSNASAANPATNTKVPVDYAVKVTYTNGCVRTDTVSVTPAAIADAGPDIMICSGQSAVVGTAAVAGMTYSWSGGPFDGPSNVAQPAVNPTSTTSYTVTVTGSGCVTTDQVTVTVNAPADFSITGNTAICEGGTATVGLSAAPAPNTTWQWSPTIGVADAANPNTSITAVDTTTYRLTQTNIITGCSNYKEVVIVVRPNNISLTAPDMAVCSGEATPMSINVSPSGSYQYVWEPSTGLSDGYVANPTVTTGIDRNYILTVTDNVSKCQAVDTVQVTIKPEQECLPPVNLQGNVFHDANALLDAQVNNTSAIPVPAGLFATLVTTESPADPVKTVAVEADGSYDFGITAADNYQIILHRNPAGSTVPDLPAEWMNTGENLNLGVGSDIAIDGILTNVTVADVNVANANFGIQQPPVSDPKSYTIDQPMPGTEIVLNGSHVTIGSGTSSPDQLTGNDAEDGLMNGNSANRTLVIASPPVNGELWYNGALVTGGQRITNYSSTLLSARLTNSNYTSFTFGYSFVDEAGVESAAAPYTIQWAYPLPVTLKSFTASRTGNTALLQWKTASEQHSDHFVVERSADALNWQAIGTVQAAGNSATERNYNFTDKQPMNGINYYRLKLVDKDAGFKYSEIRIADFRTNLRIVANIVPNPAHQVATLVFSKAPAEEVTVKLYNALGQLQQTWRVPGGARMHTLHLPGLPKGLYHVQVTGSGIGEQIRLIIQ